MTSNPVKLSEFNHKHLGRALGLLAPLEDRKTVKRRRTVPAASVVLHQYAPGRTLRAEASIAIGESYVAPNVQQFNVGDQEFFVPTSEYHQLIAAVSLGHDELRVWVTEQCEIQVERFHINEYGLWRDLGEGNGAAVLEETQFEMTFLTALGVVNQLVMAV